MDKFTIEVDARTIYDSLRSMESKNTERIGILEKFKIKSAAFIAGVVAVVQVMLSYFPQIKF